MIHTQQEVLTYRKHEIDVSVLIDYRNENISIVHYHDNRWQPKQFLFSKRGLTYMNGWREILSTISDAIDEAEKRLKKEVGKRDKEMIDNIVILKNPPF